MSLMFQGDFSAFNLESLSYNIQYDRRPDLNEKLTETIEYLLQPPTVLVVLIMCYYCGDI